MRTLSAPALAALDGRALPVALLVEMDLTPGVNLSSANVDMTIAGVSYLGTRGLGSVEAVKDTNSEVAQLRFELTGVPPSHVAMALGQPVQGKAVRIKVALFDPVTFAVLDVRTRWTGRLDVMTLVDSPQLATISVTAEHIGIDLLRPRVSLYSDAEQQRQTPGDLFLQFVNDQAEQRVVWPAASWGRK